MFVVVGIGVLTSLAIGHSIKINVNADLKPLISKAKHTFLTYQSTWVLRYLFLCQGSDLGSVTEHTLYCTVKLHPVESINIQERSVTAKLDVQFGPLQSLSRFVFFTGTST